VYCDQRDTFHVPSRAAERGTLQVVVLTAVMMVVEIVAGLAYGSMALLADGWHMGTHVAALGISVVAYALARRWADSPRFVFGTWKVEVLGGFASAIILAVIAVLMAGESVRRLFSPLTIAYDQAVVVAVIGLLVNLASAFLLQRGRVHAGDHHTAGHADLNLRAAYLHVVADATTSLLAIVALAGGRLLGWSWLDPVMGIVGAVLVSVWAWGLLRETSAALVDGAQVPMMCERAHSVLTAEPGVTVRDLHVLRIGQHQLAAVVAIEAEKPHSPAHYKALLAGIADLTHITLEVRPR
jgi:cation diffusion facilitator family transporter